jgi:hypothetical protein
VVLAVTSTEVVACVSPSEYSVPLGLVVTVVWSVSITGTMAGTCCASVYHPTPSTITRTVIAQATVEFFIGIVLKTHQEHPPYLYTTVSEDKLKMLYW